MASKQQLYSRGIIYEHSLIHIYYFLSLLHSNSEVTDLKLPILCVKMN